MDAAPGDEMDTAARLDSQWTDWLSEARNHLTDILEKSASVVMKREEAIAEIDSRIDAGAQRIAKLEKEAQASLQRLSRKLKCPATISATAAQLEKTEARTLLASANQVTVMRRQLDEAAERCAYLQKQAIETEAHAIISTDAASRRSVTAPAA